jgi:hypothetical protein
MSSEYQSFHYSYSDLEDTTNYDCDQKCLCRETGDRSVKDKMYYDYYVLNKPVPNMPKQSNIKNNNSQYKIPSNKWTN